MTPTGNEGPQLVRSFVAVGAGFFAIQMIGWGADAAFRPAVLDGRALLIMLAYTAALEAFGGYVTARIAIRRPVAHAVWLGAIVVAMSGLFTALTWRSAPAWYQIWKLLLVLPMTVLGAHIYQVTTDGKS